MKAQLSLSGFSYEASGTTGAPRTIRVGGSIVGGSALFSTDGTRRHVLSRELGGRRTLCFVGQNPSDAGADRNDPTVHRCIHLTRILGFGRFDLVNEWDLISSTPDVLATHPEPNGPENDRYIVATARAAQLVICAWGSGGALFDRDKAVCELLRRAGVSMFHLGLNLDGSPKHPHARGKHRIPDAIVPTMWSGA